MKNKKKIKTIDSHARHFLLNKHVIHLEPVPRRRFIPIPRSSLLNLMRTALIFMGLEFHNHIIRRGAFKASIIETLWSRK